MPEEINLSDTQGEFEEKVYAVADEVLSILKELSQEWLDSPLEVIKKYIDSLSTRNRELEGALKAGEGIRSYIDNANFSYQGTQIPLTISVGVSAFKKRDDCTTVFERADRALYLAKRSGRNMVKTEADDVKSQSVLEQKIV